MILKEIQSKNKGAFIANSEMFLRPNFKPEDAFVHYVFLPPGKNDYVIDGKFFESIVVDLNHEGVFLP